MKPGISDLLEAIKAHGDDPWFEALLYAALDKSHGQLGQAVKMAEDAYRARPEPDLEDEED